MDWPTREELDNSDLAEALSTSMLCLQLVSFQYCDGQVSVLKLQNNDYGNFWNIDRAIMTFERSEWLIDSLVDRKTRNESSLFSSHYPLAKTQFTYNDRQFQVDCGEASGNGAFGYVVLSELTPKKVLWQLFLDEFNPFELAWLDCGRLHLFSTCGWCCSIPLDHPNTVICEKWPDLFLKDGEIIKNAINDRWSNKTFPPLSASWLRNRSGE